MSNKFKIGDFVRDYSKFDTLGIVFKIDEEGWPLVIWRDTPEFYKEDEYMHETNPSSLDIVSKNNQRAEDIKRTINRLHSLKQLPNLIYLELMDILK